MPTPAERFIEAAVRPLADNAELQVAARCELAQRIDPSDTGLDEAARRLERNGEKRRWWKPALYAVMVLVSAVSLGTAGRTAALNRQLFSSFAPGLGNSIIDTSSFYGRGLTDSERLLLLGDTTKALKSDRMKALWDSEPENPVYFAEYSLCFLQDHMRLPPDFLETAARLDPGNAWFTLTAAGEIAKGSVKKEKLTSKGRKDRELPNYTVLDPKRYDEALALVHTAAAQTRFDSYQSRLLAERIPLLPKRTDFASQVLPMGYAASVPTGIMHLRHALEAVDAKAAELIAARDGEGLCELIRDWEACMRTWAKAESSSLIETLVLRIYIAAGARRFHTGAEELGLSEEAARWKPIADWVEADRRARQESDHDDRLRLRGGVFVGVGLPLVAKQTRRAPEITDEDLKPGRLAEHELFGRISSAALWLALGLMLAAAGLYRFRSSLLIRRLAKQFENLLTPSDWAWILGGGIVAPFLYHLALSRLTPLGARDWSLAASKFAVPSGQFGAMGWLMILLPVLIARRRLALRGAALGLGTGRTWASWTAVLCGALALPVIGLTFHGGPASGKIMIAGGVLLGAAQLAWLVIGTRAIFGRRRQLLRRVILSRVLMPAYALAMLLMAGAIPAYHAAERHWIAREKLLEISPDAPALGRYEYEVARAMRQELLEILGAMP